MNKSISSKLRKQNINLEDIDYKKFQISKKNYTLYLTKSNLQIMSIGLLHFSSSF